MINRCVYCNKKFEENELLWYCNNCEEYLDENCVINHIKHDIIPVKYVNKKFEVINITPYVAGAAPTKWFLFTENEFLKSKKIMCKHVFDEFKKYKPIIVVDRNKLYCCNCFNKNYEKFKEKEELGSPYVLLGYNEKVRDLSYATYGARNINYSIITPKHSKRGEHIKIELTITNLSKNDINDVNLNVFSFSNLDIEENENILMNLKIFDEKLIINTHEYLPIIKAKSDKKIIFDVYIPKNNEIKTNELRSYETVQNNELEFLQVSNPLRLYFIIDFKDMLNITFEDYIGRKSINLK